MDEEIERRKKIFYEEFADGGFEFGRTEILTVQTVLLSDKSPVFHKLFKESTSPDRLIRIRDHDFAIFKLFLDCLMDFQDCSVTDALLVYPLSRKYECKHLTAKCLEILEPKELNENLCMSLNLALSCECEKLHEKVLGFLDEKKLIYRIFHEEKFYSLLEPDSVYELLQYIDLDSYIIQIIFKWAFDYSQKHKISENKDYCIIANKVVGQLGINCFETTQALLDFNESELGNKFYLNEVPKYLKHFGDDADLRKCLWVNVKAGETLTEKLSVKKVALLSDYNVSVKVYRNPLIFYEYPSDEKEKMITYEYKYKLVNPNGGEIKTGSKVFWETVEEVFLQKVHTPWSILNSRNGMANLEIEVKLIFHYDCRFLKRSPKNYDVSEPNPENLYFTDTVEVELVDKALNIKCPQP